LGLLRLWNFIGEKERIAKALVVNLTRAFSALILFSIAFSELKKGRKVVFVFASTAYGRFLSISMITAPIMIITIITAAIPNSTVPVDARPVTGGAVGAGVGGGELAKNAALAEDP
jgi:hypothetical protein